MIKVEHSVIIDRPVPEVFAFVTDPTNNVKWQDGLVESRIASSGPMKAGAQVIDVRRFLGRDMESKLEVIVFEPNKRFTQKVMSGPWGAGGFFKRASGMVQKQLESPIKGDAERLKKVLEG